MLFKTRILVASVALLLFFGVAAGASARGLSSPEYSVLRAMNAVRASHGLPRLRIDYRLESVARAHSVDMLRHQYFAHGAFSARVNASGAAGPIFGENLALGRSRRRGSSTRGSQVRSTAQICFAVVSGASGLGQ
jgi:uncharacterized protein YkwD